MPSKSKVLYDDVAKACGDLMAAGKSPSFDTVYDALGRKGSAKIVQEMIIEWRRVTGGLNGIQSGIAGVPDELAAVVREFSVSFFKKSIDLANDGLAEYREQSAALVKASQEAESLVRNELSSTHVALEALKMETIELRAQLSESVAKNAQMNERNNSLSAETQRLASALSKVSNDFEAACLEHTLKIESLDSERLKERQDASGERNRLLVELDKVRQESIQHINSVNRNKEAAEARLTQLSSEISTLLQETASLKTKIELLESTIVKNESAVAAANQLLSEKTSKVAVLEELLRQSNLMAENAIQQHAQAIETVERLESDKKEHDLLIFKLQEENAKLVATQSVVGKG